MHRTCLIPGCDVVFDRCEVHHLIEWERGGRTDLDNLGPLCVRHHHLVHAERWVLRLDPVTRELTIVRRVIAPMLRPELIAAAVLAFAAHWNLVLYPRVMTTEPLWTVQAFLTELLRTRQFEWGLLGAAALVASAPIITLYLLVVKRLIQVFEAGFRS
jgi:hypothetical protein